MPYVSEPTRAKIKTALKVAVPKGWRYSVAFSGGQARLTVAAAPVDLIADLIEDAPRGYIQLGPYALERAFRSAEVVAVMRRIFDALNIDNHNNSDAQTDYFDVGHYVRVDLGRWDRPFETKAAQ